MHFFFSGHAYAIKQVHALQLLIEEFQASMPRKRSKFGKNKMFA